jgi:hypothetical protein
MFIFIKVNLGKVGIKSYHKSPPPPTPSPAEKIRLQQFNES